jgi:predicted hotdog family 3-hydroxylacyl-ACP dehydratase
MEINIPQQPPFRMINEINYFDDSMIICSYTISNENPLVEQNKFVSEGIIEFMAQSAAAFASKQNKTNNKENNIGYLVQIKSFNCNSLISVDNEIIAEITLINDITSFKIFQGKVFLNTKEIASAEIRTYENI